MLPVNKVSFNRYVINTAFRSKVRQITSSVLLILYLLIVFFYLPIALFGSIDFNAIDDGLKSGEFELQLDMEEHQLAHELARSDLLKCLRIFNSTGGKWATLKTLIHKFNNEIFKDPFRIDTIKRRMTLEMRQINKTVTEAHSRAKRHIDYEEPRITVATVICGARRNEAQAMLKSLLIFNQDAALHLIIFSDTDTVIDVAEDLLVLKWSMQERFGTDFTYELHIVQYPENDEVNWKEMYRLCATERLFFADLLPHIDSVIYVDTDAIFLSNVTDFWTEFSRRMENKEAIAAASNNEELAKGWYGPWLHIPFYGKRGVNAGVLLMNLTRLREYKFAEQATATMKLYRDQIQLADQDIINIVLAAHPENGATLSCTYNFHWGHCGNPNSPQYKCSDDVGANHCFCRTTHYEGVRIVHGNSGTFYGKLPDLTFLPQIFNGFSTFNLLTDSATVLIQDLMGKFDSLPRSPCRPLTAKMLYGNAYSYLRVISEMR